MSFRLFAFGLTTCFACAWLAMVVVPFFKLRNPSPVAFQAGVDVQEGFYFPKKSGRVVNGALVYAENGCYQCHTQVVRPTYAGNELGRPNVGGLSAELNPDGIDSRRESNVFDYSGLDFAMVGVTRIGPDLMNYGRRAELEFGGNAYAEVLRRIYDPRLAPERKWSSCPSMTFLFEKHEVHGPRSNAALEVPVEEGFEILPGDRAEALASYLLSLKHDDPVPASMDYAPAKPAADQEG